MRVGKTVSDKMIHFNDILAVGPIILKWIIVAEAGILKKGKLKLLVRRTASSTSSSNADVVLHPALFFVQLIACYFFERDGCIQPIKNTGPAVEGFNCNNRESRRK